MLYAPQFDPTALQIGSFSLRWYGIMYLLGFLSGYLLGRYRASLPGSTWSKEDVDELLTSVMIGIIFGGRIGYVLFYDLGFYLSNPLEILYIWNGGMSFHGGLLGVVAAFWWFSRKRKKTFLNVADFAAPMVPPGIFFGRIGNFINGELWGKPADLPWAMIYPPEGPEPRHPSQLYEACFEGLVLFVLLWIFSRKKRPDGAVAGFFAVGYGIFRFLVEFVRTPDAHIGYLAFGWLTMGQVLCMPLIIIGLCLLLYKGWRPLPEQEIATGKPSTPAQKKRKK